MTTVTTSAVVKGFGHAAITLDTVNIVTSSTTAFTVAKAGSNAALKVDTSTTSAVTGLLIKSAASTGGLALSVINGSTNENLTIDAKGSGTVTIAGTSTGAIVLGAPVSVAGGFTVSDTGLTITAGGLTVTDGGITVAAGLIAAGTSGTPLANTTANTAGAGFFVSQAAGAGNNLGIGVYSEAHIIGNQTDHTYGGGFWINQDSGTQTAGTILSPMDNGIYQAGGTLTNVNVFFGGRLEGIVTSTPAIFSPFSLNTNNRTITSLFDGAAAPSVGLVNGAFSGTIDGKVPLVSVNGSVRWVAVYTTLS